MLVCSFSTFVAPNQTGGDKVTRKNEKKVWERGEKIEVVAGLARIYLSNGPDTCITRLFNDVRNEIKRQNLDIKISPSSLQKIITTDKWGFDYLKATSEKLQVAPDQKLMIDILNRINANLAKISASESGKRSLGNVRPIRPDIEIRMPGKKVANR
jgi:hypothetical protein